MVYDDPKLIKLWQTKEKQITCYLFRALWSVIIISLFCVFFLTELKFTWHKIHHFKVYNLVDFSIFRKLYNHHYLFLEHFYHLSNVILIFLNTSQPWAATNLCPVLMDLPVSGISYKWNYTLNDLLCQASFIYHVFKAHLCCSLGQY